MSWRDRATCRTLTTEEAKGFFSNPVSAACRAACEGCPVVDECLQDDLDTTEDYFFGYRAKLTAGERAAIKDPGSGRHGYARHAVTQVARFDLAGVGRYGFAVERVAS